MSTVRKVIFIVFVIWGFWSERSHASPVLPEIGQKSLVVVQS